MTCVVGLVANGRVYMGADSAGANDWQVTVRADAKLFRNGPFLMGFTSSFRMGQLLRYRFQPPKHEPAMDAHHYMVAEFVGAVRTCLREGGYAKKENEQESGGQFLVGYRGRLFMIDSDYQVEEALDGYSAVGSGWLVALGALFASKDWRPEERVQTALAAAEHMTGSVRGPYLLLAEEPIPARACI